MGAGGLVLLGGAAIAATGCSDGDAQQPSPTSTEPVESLVPLLPELPDDNPLRHWSALTTREVLAFGRAVSEVDPGAAAHAVDRLAATPDSQDPLVAMRALNEACAADIAAGELVTVDTWTLPRTLAGLAAGLAAAE